jgi:hypothetical protein
MPSGLDCPVESASATNWPLVDEGRDTGGIGSSFLRELTPLLSGSSRRSILPNHPGAERHRSDGRNSCP